MYKFFLKGLSHRWVVGFVRGFSHSKIFFVKVILIFIFTKAYSLDLSKIKKKSIYEYSSFNAFFTRELLGKPDFSKLNSSFFLSPVDGILFSFGKLSGTNLSLDVKKHYFSLKSLLAGDDFLFSLFRDGFYSIFYLSPRDYHRVHIPYEGKLVGMYYVPGLFFPVNFKTVRATKHVYSKNERVICLFYSEKVGFFSIIFVGALFVGSISTSFHGVVGDCSGVSYWDYKDCNIVFKQLDEIGFFSFGSSIIFLSQKNNFFWKKKLKLKTPVFVGDVFLESGVKG
jgi:phosphatidylserine decarboxylase